MKNTIRNVLTALIIALCCALECAAAETAQAATAAEDAPKAQAAEAKKSAGSPVLGDVEKMDKEALNNARNLRKKLEAYVENLGKTSPKTVEFLMEKHFGISTAQYIAAAAILLLTIIVAKYGLNFALKKLSAVSAKTLGENAFMPTLLAQIQRPLNIIAAVLGVYFAATFLVHGASNVILLSRAAGVVFWTAVFWCAGILSDAFFISASKRLKKSTATTANLLDFIRRVVKFFIYIIALLSILTNFGINVNTIIASLGIGGMALAFASQDTIANFFGSVSIILDRPFIVGDLVKTGSCEGTVEAIGFRSTRIRTAAKTLITIPNSGLAKESVENLSKRPSRKVAQTIGITYSATADDMEALMADLRSKLVKIDGVAKSTGISAEFSDFADSSLNIEIIYYTIKTDRANYMATRRRVNLEIMRIVAARGLSFAFPSMSMYVESMPKQN